MERLWAPWRLDYVGREDKKGDGGCFLCTAAQSVQDGPHRVLWRGRTCFAILNRYPYNNGHLMVAPNEHKSSLAELTDEERLEHLDLIVRCQAGLTRTVRPAGFNVGLNLGAAAGAGLADHLHWHIVPRWTGDTNFMPVLADTKIIPQSLDQLWRMLRQTAAD
ncbi:MAG: HIT domain-containing protein [Candidatus Brocadiaceae bacterium]|nr:HIT domain-containing protein [Candidatus Brocadiaceae bacterium]